MALQPPQFTDLEKGNDLPKTARLVNWGVSWPRPCSFRHFTLQIRPLPSGRLLRVLPRWVWLFSRAGGPRYQVHSLPQGMLPTSPCWCVGFGRA